MKSLALLSAALPAILAQYGEEYGCSNDTVVIPASTSTVTVMLESTADAIGGTPSGTSVLTIADADSTASDDIYYYVIRNGTTSWIGSAPSSQDFQGASTVTSTVTLSADASAEASQIVTEGPGANATSDDSTTLSEITSFITRRVTVTSFNSDSSATVSGSIEVDAAGVSSDISNETATVVVEVDIEDDGTDTDGDDTDAEDEGTDTEGDDTDAEDVETNTEDLVTETLTVVDFTLSTSSGALNATVITASTQETGVAANATTDSGSIEVDGLGGSTTVTESATMVAYGDIDADETNSISLTTSCSPSVFPGFSSGSVTSPSSTLLVCVITTADGLMPMTTETDDAVSEDLTTSATAPFANSTLLTLTVSSSSTSEATDVSVAGSMTADGIFANQTSSDAFTVSNSFDVEPTGTTEDSGPTESPCGEWGNFTLSWDDEPVFTPEDNATAPYPPVFNPYHNLFFSNGYAYIPPPNSPFEASTGSRFAIFLTEEAKKDFGSRHAAGAEPGEIGAGPRMAIDAFWFNAYGANLGCDNEGPGNCFMRISGYEWDEARQNDTMAAQQIAVISPCNQTSGCELTPVTFQDDFRKLTAIKIEAYAGGSARNWYMDDLSLGWWNNTCAAGLRRLENRV